MSSLVNSAYQVGAHVKVRRLFPVGHIRTPRYIMGLSGTISHVLGPFPNPEDLAYGFDGEPKRILYRVRFPLPEVWPDYSGSKDDTLEIELYEHWLEHASEGTVQ